VVSEGETVNCRISEAGVVGIESRSENAESIVKSFVGLSPPVVELLLFCLQCSGLISG
jgi:hypothetical protein